MENKPTVFNHPNFGTIRTAGTPDNPIFCLIDVCRALGIKNSRDVSSRLDEDDVDTADTIDSLGRVRPTTFVNEAGLYEAIFISRKKEARAFRKWVTSEVLPSIRKTGGYGYQRENSQPERLSDIFAESKRLANEMRDELSNGKALPIKDVILTAYDVAIYCYLRNGIASSQGLPFCVTNTMISTALGINIDYVQPAWERLEQGGYIVTRKFGDKRAFILGSRVP